MKKVLALALAALLALTACGAPGGEVSADTPAPSETVSPSPETPEPDASPSTVGVYTDWSALEPYEPTELIFRRWYEEPIHELRPLEGGYGVLVPYVGSAPPDMNWGGVYEYGLMTMDGAIVVDTTYSSVYRLSLSESGERTRLPVLALMTTESFVDERGWIRGEQRFGAAALDGSWSIPTQYDGVRAFSPEGFFLWDKDMVYVYHTDGQLRHSIPCGDIYFPVEFMGTAGLDGGVLANLEEDVLRLIDLETGESAYVEGVSDMIWPGDGLFPVCSVDSGLWGCVDRTGAWVIPARYQHIYWAFGDGSGVVSVYVDGAERFADREGNEYSRDPRPQQPQTPPEELDSGVSPIEDPYTGKTWYVRMLPDRPGYLIEDRQGNVLGNATVQSSSCSVVNGLFLNIDGETAGYKDADGNWVFRILLAEAGD